MQISKIKFGAMLLIAFVLGGLVTFGVTTMGLFSDKTIDSNKLGEIQKNIDKYYLNDYDKDDLIEGVYKGYVAGLDDPYSSYMTPTEYESWEATSIGDYDGVGMTFSEDGNGLFVAVEITAGSPAEKAGVKPGDVIISVDGKQYSDIDLMAAAIRGKAGTNVKIEFMRDDKTFEKTIVREHISLPSVESKIIDGDIGYIKISRFVGNTGVDFLDALAKVRKEGAGSLILDLRDNGGGMVDQCVEVADQFLDEGPVCYVEDKYGNSESYDAEESRTELETVVLVNENSASASEILAGAMKDNGYKLVGQKTFGKGVIQRTIQLSDKSALKLTIMQYLSPDKHVIQKKGIRPNYKVKDKEDTEADEQLEKAESLLAD